MKINQEHIDAVAEYLGEENIRYFKHLKGLTGDVFPVLRINRERKGIPIHPVHLREGMQIRNYLRKTFPNVFVGMDQNKIERYTERLMNKLIKSNKIANETN